MSLLPFKTNSVLASANQRTLIKINQSNFLQDFYSNENLLGDNGKNYYVVFEEDINLGSFAGKFNKSFTPIGRADAPLTAVINGNNKKLHNVSILKDEQNFVAIFGFVNTKIFDLSLNNIQITAKNFASGFCYDSMNSIFENVMVENVSLTAKHCANFCINSSNSFFRNIEVDVSNNASEDAYKFAKTSENDGFSNIGVETAALCAVIDNYSLENWQTDVETKFENLNILYLTTRTENVVNETAEERPKESHHIANMVAVSIASVIVISPVVLLLRNKLLTKKKECDNI